MPRLLIALALPFFCGAAAGEGTQRVTDLAYVADGSPKHRLDLYLPRERREAPLVVFVHGGAFMSGDRRGYGAVGRALSAEGFAVAIPSYRLFPQSDARGATEDVAAALAWLAKNVSAYGVDASGVILAGHSAGGQIAAMLATHERYLAAAGAPPSFVRGAFVLAGAYDLRDLSGEPDDWQRTDEGIFGATPEARARISPGIDFDSDTPPIVAVCGTLDDPGACPRARTFVRRLAGAGRDATALAIEGADHTGLLSRFIAPDDALAAAFRTFVKSFGGARATPNLL